MNCQNRISQPQLRALVDDFLRAALDFRVAALHRIEVELGGIRARRHRAGCAAAHADAHAGAADLDQQRAGGEQNLVGQFGINRADAAGNHDGLVITPALAADGLLVFAEVTVQVGPAKLVVERRAAQRAFRHDLQRAGDVAGLAVTLALVIEQF